MSKIQESGEMYLESILVLRQRLGSVRAIDIVKLTGYSKPSISRALSNLRAGGMISVDQEGYITLTADGEMRAQKVYERHRVLTEFFALIGVSEEIADADACKIEHDISDDTFLKIKEHLLRMQGESK